MTDAVWIKTEPSVDGSTYIATVEFSDDRSIVLTPDSAPRYAMTVLEAVARAEYDAAVFTQMSKRVDQKAVAQLITDLRKDRPDIDTSATKPLEIKPGVNRQGEPFLIVLIDDKPVGQWEIAAAKEHALTVLEVTKVADLDASYYRALTGLVGLEEHVARNVVDDLQHHRS
jgi:hypothetical protein